MTNKLTHLFLNKLTNLVENCQALYWNEQGTGFIIVDKSKLEEKLVQKWEHHLRTFLKKLDAYGFRRRMLFEGIQYTHIELQNKGRINPYVKQQEISIEQKIKIQQRITTKLLGLTKLIHQTNQSEENLNKKTKKLCQNNQKALNKITFKLLSQGSSLDRHQLMQQIRRIRDNIMVNKSQLQFTFKKLQECLGEQNDVVSLIRQPLQKQHVSQSSIPAPSIQSQISPVKAQQQNN